MKSIDGSLGKIATLVLPSPAVSQPNSVVRSLLVIRPGGIGDAALLVPAIRVLQRRFPEATISVLAENRNAAAFLLCSAVSHVLHYHKGGDLVTVLSRRYDVVIDTEQWHRLSAVVARLIRSRTKIGYGTNDRARLFTHVVQYSHGKYEAESFLDLLRPLGINAKFDPEEPFLSVPPEAARRAEELLSGVGRFVTIFPGASIPERRWGRERFHDLVRRLARCGVATAVVGGPCDAADGAAIVAGTSGLNLAGKCSLPETAAVIGRSELLVSGDSGILHIAVGLGTPTVSLFGPGIQEKWGPQRAKHVVINRKVSCSPCTRFGTTPHCPYDNRCMAEIGVGEVEAAVRRSLRI